MAGDESGSRRPPVRDSSAELLGKLRAFSIGVILVLVVVLALVQASGRQVGDVFFATLLGAFLALFGIDRLAR